MCTVCRIETAGRGQKLYIRSIAFSVRNSSGYALLLQCSSIGGWVATELPFKYFHKLYSIHSKRLIAGFYSRESLYTLGHDGVAFEGIYIRP